VRAVNLLPREEGRGSRSKSKKSNPVVLVGGLGGFVVVASLGFLALTSGSTVTQKRDELESLKVQLAVTPKPVADDAPAGAQLGQQRDKRLAAVNTVLSRRVAWDRVLRQFALVLPEDVWLTSLAAKSPGAAAGAAPVPPPVPGTPATVPTGFTIVGYTYSHNGVARLLSRLGVVANLTNVQLQRSAVAEVGGREIVQFTILADVRDPGVTS